MKSLKNCLPLSSVSILNLNYLLIKKTFLVLISLLFLGCYTTPSDKDIRGRTYYGIFKDSTTVHYLRFNKKGNGFTQYYKDKDTIVQHTGTWTDEGRGTFYFFPWRVFEHNQINPHFNMKFGDTMMMSYFAKDYYLADHPDRGSNAKGSLILEGYIKKEKQDRARQEASLKAYWADKDTLYYPSGKIKAIGKTDDFGDKEEKIGIWQYFYENGQLKAEGNYSRYKHWLWKHYYPNGQLKTVGAYESGYKVGSWEHYHDNGQLESKGIYIYIYINDSIRKSFKSKKEMMAYREKKMDTWTYYNKEGKLIKTKKHPSREKYYDDYNIELFKDDGIEYAKQKTKEYLEQADRYYKQYKAELRKQDSIKQAQHQN